ncbi:hypothetical protein TeGR_g8104 [Tetraparma gracilis]|uniref:Prohibitin n=1 Tax=Tetraparma gracilis TaxID=2962635 RepID=A0ABQ6N5H7_9STRA|nr:hypothetical protein TeGR_g8104 [Tetraparma gracilis]
MTLLLPSCPTTPFLNLWCLLLSLLPPSSLAPFVVSSKLLPLLPHLVPLLPPAGARTVSSLLSLLCSHPALSTASCYPHVLRSHFLLGDASQLHPFVEGEDEAAPAPDGPRAVVMMETIIAKAKGEAAAAKLIGQSVRENPAFVKLRKIEAAQEIATTLTQAPSNKLYLNADALMLNLAEEAKPVQKKKGWLW